MSGQNYRDLIAWQKAMDLVEGVYQSTRPWPREELYGLTGQVRRAAGSIAANIAEGQGRTSKNEFLHHLSIAHGSLREVETLVLIAQRLGYAPDAPVANLMDSCAEVGRLLHGLMRSLR
jgi:four helix bundle protein